MCKDNARYKRRWDLRLLGLLEKDNEDVKEAVIGILARVIPVAVDKIRELVDTVHRLGKKNDPVYNKMPRPIIIQYATRTARNDIWKKSKDARVCKTEHPLQGGFFQGGSRGQSQVMAESGRGQA